MKRLLVPLILSLVFLTHVAYRASDRLQPAPALRRSLPIRATPLGRQIEPASITHRSPNYGLREYGPVDLIVIHCTASSSTRSTINHFLNVSSRASSHILIPDRGLPGEPDKTIRLVPDELKSWHVRREAPFQGRFDVNSRSLGIEITNSGLAQDPYSDWQVEETARWCRYWMYRYPIRAIVTHAYLDPNRRRDPCTTFPWERWSKLVTRDLFQDPQHITLMLGPTTLTTDGLLSEGRLWIELRPLSKVLGYQVRYDARQKLAVISK